MAGRGSTSHVAPSARWRVLAVAAVAFAACGDSDRAEIPIGGDGGTLLDASWDAASDAGPGGTNGCEVELLDFAAAAVVTRAFGATVVGDRVHLVYGTNACAPEVHLRESRSLTHASFPTSGGSSEVATLQSELCVKLREPTLVPHPDGRIALFTGIDAQGGDDVQLRELGSNAAPTVQTSTPDDGEFRLAGAVIAGVPTVAYVPAPIHPGASTAAPIFSVQAGGVAGEILPLSAQHHPIQLAITSLGGDAATARGIAVWVSDLPPNVGTFLRRLDGLGRGSGDVVQITSSVNEGSYVALASRGITAGFIYGESFEGVTQELRFRSIAADGTIGRPVTLTSGTHDVGQLALTPYRNGYAVVSRRLGSVLNESVSLEVLAIDALGARGGVTEIAQTTHTGTAVQALFASDGRLIVVWDELQAGDGASVPTGTLRVRVARLTCR